MQKESQKLINQRQEDTFCFQLQKINKLTKESKKEGLESMVKEINYNSNNNITNLPPIRHQMINEESKNMSFLFSQEIKCQEAELEKFSEKSRTTDEDGQK